MQKLLNEIQNLHIIYTERKVWLRDSIIASVTIVALGCVLFGADALVLVIGKLI